VVSLTPQMDQLSRLVEYLNISPLILKHQIVTKIKKVQELSIFIDKYITLHTINAPRKICQLSSKERELQKSNHEYK